MIQMVYLYVDDLNYLDDLDGLSVNDLDGLDGLSVNDLRWSRCYV